METMRIKTMNEEAPAAAYDAFWHQATGLPDDILRKLSIYDLRRISQAVVPAVYWLNREPPKGDVECKDYKDKRCRKCNEPLDLMNMYTLQVEGEDLFYCPRHYWQAVEGSARARRDDSTP